MKSVLRFLNFPQSPPKREHCCSTGDSKVFLGRLIGYGNFSIAHVGTLTSPSGGLQSVVVKIPRDNEDSQVSVHKEAAIMSHIGQHDFILEIMGTIDSLQIQDCMLSGTFILTKLCVNGSLQSYLRWLKQKMSKADDTSSRQPAARTEAYNHYENVVVGTNEVTSLTNTFEFDAYEDSDEVEGWSIDYVNLSGGEQSRGLIPYDSGTRRPSNDYVCMESSSQACSLSPSERRLRFQSRRRPRRPSSAGTNNMADLLLEDSVRLLEALKFSYQISSGMEYITSKNIIHGDLSTRNVFLDENKNCKIADFGLSRFMKSHLLTNEINFQCDVTLLGQLPWRWMAPECLDGDLWSLGCDVWSYGVTLWEIFTTGDCPFSTMRCDENFKAGLKSGELHLPKPDLAGESVYGVIQDCCNIDCELRPTFENLTATFHTWYTFSEQETSGDKLLAVENLQPTKIQQCLPTPDTYSNWENVEESNPEKIYLGMSSTPSGVEIPLKAIEFELETAVATVKDGMPNLAWVYGKRVHVKILRNGSEQELNGMLNEVKKLVDIGKHSNIVELVGCCTAEVHKGMLYTASAFCKNGSLKRYLKRSKGRVTKEFEVMKEFSSFAVQIASALGYLSSKHIVHVDLCTRNVLLDDTNTCKLHNFELSRHPDEYSDYAQGNGSQVAWRWAAPEIFERKVYSTKSDMWSYGVTLWEIYSCGELPFRKETWSNSFLHSIQTGMRLECPELAAQNIYGTMLACWSYKPELRPTWTDLIRFFTHENSKYAGDYLNL